MKITAHKWLNSYRKHMFRYMSIAISNSDLHADHINNASSWYQNLVHTKTEILFISMEIQIRY